MARVQRSTVSMPPSLYSAINDFRFQNRLGSFSGAMEQLILLGFEHIMQSKQCPLTVPAGPAKMVHERFLELRDEHHDRREEFEQRKQEQSRLLNEQRAKRRQRDKAKGR